MLSISTAKIDITPSSPVWLDGFGNRTKRSEGAYHPLHAKALVLDDGGTQACLITAEVLAFDRRQSARVKDAISGATGIPSDHVILTATHTHCAPRIRDTVMPGDLEPDVQEAFERQVVAVAAQAAAASRHPVSVSFSRGRGLFGVNRRLPAGKRGPNPDGPMDRDLDTFWFTGTDGKVAASFTIYACHPTSRGQYLMGGDFPAFLVDQIEEKIGGNALYAMGCGGDTRPHFAGPDGNFREGEIAEIEAEGRALGDEALAAKDRAEPVPVERIAVKTAHVPLALVPHPSREDYARIAAEDRNALIRKWAGRMIEAMDRAPLPRFVPFEIQTLAFNDAVQALFLAGEVVTDIGLRIKRLFPDRRLAVAAYADGVVAYVPSRKMYPEGGYEVDGSHFYYVQPAPFTADVEDAIAAQVQEMIG
ncbi:MAG: hypothetical protein EXS64_18650 [Candidatus Latescibacteria bacterium]|nr:hypothetical protein [Candidatus Latescibacterota bacterium]